VQHVSLWTGVAVTIAAFVLMEPLTAVTHRWVMHGFGIGLHRSHHRRVRPGESPRRWEANDAYPVMFAALVMMGFAVGFNVAGFAALVPVGIGVTAYGIAYALVHDVYIHRRLPLFGDRPVPGLERLAAAHRVHHERNAAPYGMLAPLRSSRSRSGSRTSATATQHHQRL
jgi:beta-carotene 3-hydroxylase